MWPLVCYAFLGFCGYATLLPVAPLWAVRGGATETGAGLVNAVLLIATVATQFAVPALIRRFGWGTTMAAGLALQGVPALLHLLTHALTPTLALSAVRGIGFGILTVTGSAAAALLVEPARRGKAIGAFSLAVSIPNVLLMPLGPWAGDALGFGWVFVVAALPLLGIGVTHALARNLPHRSTHAPGAVEQHDPTPLGRLATALTPPILVLFAITLAGGAIITFAPQAVAQPWLGTAGLFALGLMSTLSRWRLGAYADRYGTARLTPPFAALGALAVGATALLMRTPVTSASATAWVLACAGTGLAYGALQNLTMVRAFHVAGPRSVGAASTAWNAGFDAGTAAGAAIIGSIATAHGFGPGMLVATMICLISMPFTVLPRSAA